MDCIFCKIISGDIPSYKVFENDKVMAFLDINPTSVGHTLIIPKVHTLDLTTIDDNTIMEIIKTSKEIASMIVDKLGANGYTLLQNNGIAQDVKHFHLHVIPKYNKKQNIKIEEVYNILTK